MRGTEKFMKYYRSTTEVLPKYYWSITEVLLKYYQNIATVLLKSWVTGAAPSYSAVCRCPFLGNTKFSQLLKQGTLFADEIASFSYISF